MLVEKRPSGDGSDDGEGRAEGKKKGSFWQVVVSGLKVGLSEGSFDRVVGTRIRVCRSGSRKWSCGRINSYDGTRKRHCIEYEDGETEDTDLTRREFLLESGSSKFPETCSMDLQVRRIEPKLTEPQVSKAAKCKAVRGWISGKKSKRENRGQRCDEEMAKAILTRTPAVTFKSVELDNRTSAKMITKRVKVYSFDKEDWLTGRIISYNDRIRHHLVAFEDGSTTETDLQAQWCKVELRYEEATDLFNSSSHECQYFRRTRGFSPRKIDFPYLHCIACPSHFQLQQI